MRVRVLRVSGMPFNVKIWIDDRPAQFTLYIDAELISEAGAQLLEGVLAASVEHWRRVVAETPALLTVVS